MSQIVTNQDFLKVIDSFNVGKKQISWDNIVNALDLNGIIVRPLPPDQESKILWREEKKKLVLKVKRIRKNRADQCKNESDYHVDGNLIELISFPTLCEARIVDVSNQGYIF